MAQLLVSIGGSAANQEVSRCCQPNLVIGCLSAVGDAAVKYNTTKQSEVIKKFWGLNEK